MEGTEEEKEMKGEREQEIWEGGEISAAVEEEQAERKVEEEEPAFSVDLDFFMAQMGMLDEDPPSSQAGDMELVHSSSRQDHQLRQEVSGRSEPSSARGSVQSLSGPSSTAAAGARGSDPMLFYLKGPPPHRDPASRAKTRCSTLPPRQRGTETGYSLPRPSHSTSLTRFQQLASQAPLVPLRSPAAPLSHPLSAPHTPLSPTHPLQSPLAHAEPPLSQSFSPAELFMLKGPPLRGTASRAKGRCSTLPARPRGPEAGESSAKPSQSTSFTKLGDRVPPSPSELKHNSPV